MFEIFKDAWSFIINREERWSAKASVVIVIVTFFVMIELLTGIFSGFINSQRIDQLNKVQTLLVAPGLDPGTKEYLQIAKKEILERGTIESFNTYDLWESLVSLTISANNFSRQITIPENNTATKIASIQADSFVFIQFVSSSIIWVLLSFVHILDFFIQGKYNIKAISRTISKQFVFVIYIIGCTYGFNLIPIDNMAIKFLLNIILQIWLLDSISLIFFPANEIKATEGN